MGGFRDAFAKGRAEVRAARGAPPLSRDRQETEAANYERAPYPEENPARAAEPESALHAHEDELADAKQVLAEITDYAEKLQARLVEVIAGAEVMAKALRLPGVKTFLVNSFHPDKYPSADARQFELFTEALKTITAAYAAASELRTQPSE